MIERNQKTVVVCHQCHAAIHAGRYGERRVEKRLSCLIYGETFSKEPVHSVWAYNEENRWAVLITVYRPDPRRWIDWRTRRPKDATLQ